MEAELCGEHLTPWIHGHLIPPRQMDGHLMLAPVWIGNLTRIPVRGASMDLELERAGELFCDAKTAERLSPRTVHWYRDILRRAVARFSPHAVLEAIDAPTWRARLVELRASLAPASVADDVRCLAHEDVLRTRSSGPATPTPLHVVVLARPEGFEPPTL